MDKNQDLLELKLSDPQLPDKVYTFLASDGNLTFPNIFLSENYNYYIYIEIVTPHNSTVRITLWDPDNKQFNLFESELNYESSSKRYYEIPFGTVIEGQYIFEFFVVSSENLNIYIRMEKGSKILYDKISNTEDLVFYQTNRLTNDDYIEYNIMLKTDVMYNFYISRLSAISIKESNIINIDYSILGPDSVQFEIYDNYTIKPINDLDKFNFGTALEGIYTIKITIRCVVSYVNLGYAIVEDYRIGDVIDINGTDYNGTNSIEPKGNSSYIPIMFTTITIGFIGGLFIISVIVFQKHRKKNTAELNLKEKHKIEDSP